LTSSIGFSGYRVAEDALQMLAFWHASRGSEPPIWQTADPAVAADGGWCRLSRCGWSGHVRRT